MRGTSIPTEQRIILALQAQDGQTLASIKQHVYKPMAEVRRAVHAIKAAGYLRFHWESACGTPRDCTYTLCWPYDKGVHPCMVSPRLA